MLVGEHLCVVLQRDDVGRRTLMGSLQILARGGSKAVGAGGTRHGGLLDTADVLVLAVQPLVVCAVAIRALACGHAGPPGPIGWSGPLLSGHC